MIYKMTALMVMILMTMNGLAQNWPQWRGPDANGIAAPGNYPVGFSATDDLLWKADRNYPCERETALSYTTPLVIREGNRKTIVVWGADHLTGHDAATGETIWFCGGFNPEHKALWRTIATPVLVRDRILLRGDSYLYCIGKQ